MTDIGTIDREAEKTLTVLSELASSLSYPQICKLNSEQHQEYTRLLENFKAINGASPVRSDDLHVQKGRALEELVRYLLQISGNIFEINPNLHTTTNEIDIFVTLSPLGKLLCSHGVISSRLKRFLIECKNYDKSISVTYVGKFCSLLLTNSTKLGILFSYHGVSGRGWNDASGLIKKFYLHKENEDDRYCIIDFSISDFEAISNGDNLLNIIDAKISALLMDTSFRNFLSTHPAEKSVTDC